MAAARIDASFPELVDLLTLSVADVDPLLAEEIGTWQTRFNWDFRPSADLLRRFLHARSLQGYALRHGRNVIGYAYHVLEDQKGLIGDFYVAKALSDLPTEMMLLGSTVQSLMLKPGLHRIECQLLMLNPPVSAQLPFRQFLKRHDRYFMSIDRAAIRSLTPANLKMRLGFSSWGDKFKEEAAHLVAAAYRGHVDSEINDQYRTIPGARHFLLNIIQYPGCGRFSPRSSIVAVDESSGRICGMCLSSMVSDNSGHVTQLCVLPGVRGEHIGYASAASPFGWIVVGATERGLCWLALASTAEQADASLRAEFPAAMLLKDASLSRWVDAALRQVGDETADVDSSLPEMPLDLRGTAFQLRVWQALRTIPRGETRTYSQLARELGIPNSTRAVARACATNRVSLMVPCHRVVGVSGSLTGYRWGVERKRQILEAEKRSS